MSTTTIIELGGHRYQVTCLPDDGLVTINPVEVCELMNPLKLQILNQSSDTGYLMADIINWLNKFPKPIK